MLNHLIVKQGGSLHAIQIRPISLKTSIRRPFINRFISIASHQKSPLNYDAVEVLWEISVNGRHLNYFSRGLRINPHWHLQLSSGEFYHDEKFASPYIVERIHKIHLKCLVLICESVWVKCFVEPDTIVSVQAFMLGPILRPRQYLFVYRVSFPFWDWCS